MTTTLTSEQATSAHARLASRRSDALAGVLEQGLRALTAFASTLTEAEWTSSPLAHDKRSLGVMVHHVATMYPLEIQLAQVLAGGAPIINVTWDDVHAINAKHAREHGDVTRDEALRLLAANGAAAAAAVRALSDEQLDSAASNSLYGGAPLTCQFMLEDHAVRHSYHHLAKMRAALGR
jgi:hypothetical protein